MTFLDRVRSLIRRAPHTSAWPWFTTLDGGASWPWFQTFTVAWFCTLTLPQDVMLYSCSTCRVHYPTAEPFTQIEKIRRDMAATLGHPTDNNLYPDYCNDCLDAEKADREWRKTSAIPFAFTSGADSQDVYACIAAGDTLRLMERVRAHLATLDPDPTPTNSPPNARDRAQHMLTEMRAQLDAKKTAGQPLDVARVVQTLRPPSDTVTLGTTAAGDPVTLTTADRNRHVYMIGKTGSGKSSLLRNLIMQDLDAGRGVIYLDPHGDTAQQLLGYVPLARAGDVTYFCPTDNTCPTFNLLASPYPPDKLTRDVVSAFRMFFGFDQNSAPRLSQLLTNTVLLLLLDRDHEPHSLAHVRRVLIDPDYRAQIVARCPHESVTQFWTLEFPRFPKDATLPVLNKFSDLLMPLSPMERLFSSTTNGLDLNQIMDGGKILLVNLSKGELGEAGAFLIGALIVTAVNQAALARARIPEAERRDVFLYVDEFQNFVVDSFESILSEARKYRLNLTLAHQYLAQVPSNLRSAIFGNVAVTLCLPISAEDAATMHRELARTTLALKATGEVFEPVAYFRNRARRFLDGLTIRPSPPSAGTGCKPWPVHITADAHKASQNCTWFLDTYLPTPKGGKLIPDGLTTITWPSMEDFKLLAPLSGFVKIQNAANVHRFTIHHPKQKPRDDIRRTILDRRRQEHETAQTDQQEKKRPHKIAQDERTPAETTQDPHQNATTFDADAGDAVHSPHGSDPRPKLKQLPKPPRPA